MYPGRVITANSRPTPWWRTAALAGLGAAALVLVALYLPWPFNFVAVLAAVVFLVVLLLNPATWLRRMAAACVSGATATGSLPDLSAQLNVSSEAVVGFVELSKNGALSYALLIAGLGFAALEVWRDRPGRPVRDRPKDRLDADIKAYFVSAIARHKDIELAGFKTKLRVSIRLEDLHVPLRAMLDRDPRWREPALNADEAHFRIGEQATELLLTDAFERAKELDMHALVILGEPGSGKTTHLLRLLLKIAHDGAASLSLAPGTVPVFLPLRRLVELDRGLDAFIEQELASPHLDAPKRFGERLRKRGRVLYLLDGLDEVRDSEDRAKVAGWIEEARKHAPDSWFVVTCRYAGYRAAPLSGAFLELHLRPLGEPQVQEFVRRWFAIVLARLAEPDRRKQARKDARDRADALLADLRRPGLQASARVAELTHNPLLLTTICLVHYDRGKLPERRIELYEECVDVLLERWNEAKELPQRIPASEARQVLQPLAWWMHEEDGRTVASEAELLPQVERALAVAQLDISATELLRSIRDESGLLTGWGQHQYGFMHLGLQEYLAARELRNRELLEPGAFAQVVGRFGDSWWQEVILLLLAQRDPPVFDKFMTELVEHDEFERWIVSETMGLALSEGAGASAQPFERLLKRAGGGADVSLASRQLAAARLLARVWPEKLAALADELETHEVETVRAWWSCRQGGQDIIVHEKTGIELVLIPAGSFLMGSAADDELGLDRERPQHEVTLEEFYLARTLVTNAQYGRYLAAHPDAPKPKYWGDRRFNQPDQPVVGVPWDEAMTYCEWAGLVLPTEAQWEYACRARTTTRYWSGDEESDLARVGWYDGNSEGRLHAVGEKEANPFGLYDMHGNVWEWCRDGWVDNYKTKPRTGDGLRHEPVAGGFRVFRGGSWYVTARYARSASRFIWHPGSRSYFLGFRPAQVIP